MSNQSEKKPIKPGTARNAAIINIFVTPGLGSLMAGRIFSGLGQLIVAVAGFALVMTWFFEIMVQYYGLINGRDTPFDAHAKVGLGGAVIFAVAWFWGLVTSFGILRDARRAKAAANRAAIRSS